MLKKPFVLAVDLGGTRMRAALVARSGEVLARDSAPTKPLGGARPAMERLAALLRRLVRSRPGESPQGLGLALAGPIEPATGTLVNPPNLPGWHGFSPQADLSHRLRLPSWSHNDVTLAALGEHAHGVAAGVGNLVFISWGTGIGGGLVLDGEVYDGHRGFAGELGHLVLDPGGPPCSCGSRGCLEVFTAGPAIARMAVERLEAGEPSLLRRLARWDLGRIRAETVARADQEGDPLARSVLTGAARAMGIGVATLHHILDPELIVIGGGISQMLHALYPSLVSAADEYAMASSKGRCSIASTALGDDAGLLGAAVLAWRRLDGARWTGPE